MTGVVPAKSGQGRRVPISDELDLAIDSPLLKRLYADWAARRRARSMPARDDFDPLDLKYALGKLLLVDVLYRPLQFRFRLIGTELVDRAGFDLTGKSLDAYPNPEFRALMRQHYTAVVETRRPLRSVETNLVLDGRVRRYEALLLPLAADCETVDMLLIGVVYS
jgi:hypothetical protein